MPPAETGHLVVHGTAVAWEGRAALILGASGTGKSALALQAIALGARLVADDRTLLRRDGPELLADPATAAIAGMIEARHVGLLRLPFEAGVPVGLAVDLDTVETERLPPLRHIKLLGRNLPLLRRAAGPHFAASLLFCLAKARIEP